MCYRPNFTDQILLVVPGVEPVYVTQSPEELRRGSLKSGLSHASAAPRLFPRQVSSKVEADPSLQRLEASHWSEEMKPSVSVAVLFIVALFLICCASSVAQTNPAGAQTNPVFAVSPNVLKAGDHDIGSVNYVSSAVVVKNNSSATANLLINIKGTNAEDFAARSNCPSGLASQSDCKIMVLFNPVDSNWIVERSATLEISDGKNPAAVTLSGRAFQNLGVSPDSLQLGNRRGSATNVAHSILLTNNTSATLSGIAITVQGDFTEDHSNCVNIASKGTCTIFVSHSASQSSAAHAGQAGARNGSLTIVGTLAPATVPPPQGGTAGPLAASPKLNRAIMLDGSRNSAFWSGWLDPGLLLLIVVSFLYYLGLVLVRWHMIAKPAQAQVVAEIEAVQARVIAEATTIPDSPQKTERLKQIYLLLDTAAYPFKHKRFQDYRQLDTYKAPTAAVNASETTSLAEPSPRTIHPLAPGRYPWFPTRVFNAVFWTRGHELSAWSLAHEAEREFVPLLAAEVVRARLETAEQELRDINTPLTLAVAERVHQTLSSGELLIVERARHLLQLLLPLLQPLTVPAAAGESAAFDLLQNALQPLTNLGDVTSAGEPQSLEDCKAQLQPFQTAAEAYRKFSADTTTLLALPSLSEKSKSLMQQLADLTTHLSTASCASPEGAPTDLDAELQACKASLALLAPLAMTAKALAADIKVYLSNANTTYQTLQSLCKAQAALAAAMSQATTPSAGLALVQEILTNLRQQNDLVSRINQSDFAGGIAACRDEVLQLAKLPPLPSDLIARINSVVNGDMAAPLERWRAVLSEALEQIYGNADFQYFQLTNWHNKLIWLVLCALLFIVALGLTLPNAILLLVGAIGGLLSRLQRTLVSAEAANDSTWGSLFLSPLTGAFSAWGGILLIMLGLKLNLLGSAVFMDWQNPNEPVALAIALLFGFSERLFDGLAGQIESKIQQPPSSTSTPATSAAKPTITSTSTKTMVIGKQVQVTVVGTNFQAGAKASLTDEASQSVEATLSYSDNSSVKVTYTPTGTKAYTSTLTIMNPDKQTATYNLSVTLT